MFLISITSCRWIYTVHFSGIQTHWHGKLRVFQTKKEKIYGTSLQKWVKLKERVFLLFSNISQLGKQRFIILSAWANKCLGEIANIPTYVHRYAEQRLGWRWFSRWFRDALGINFILSPKINLNVHKNVPRLCHFLLLLHLQWTITLSAYCVYWKSGARMIYVPAMR